MRILDLLRDLLGTRQEGGRGTSPGPGPRTAVPRPADPDLEARFAKVMFEEKLYLQPGLTLETLATRLHTNRTYVSRLVNGTYGQRFPDFLCSMRIAAAEEYILAHPGARQTEIAAACGFPNAPTFNAAFKKATGQTPRIWAAMHTPPPESEAQGN